MSSNGPRAPPGSLVRAYTRDSHMTHYSSFSGTQASSERLDKAPSSVPRRLRPAKRPSSMFGGEHVRIHKYWAVFDNHDEFEVPYRHHDLRAKLWFARGIFGVGVVVLAAYVATLRDEFPMSNTYFAPVMLATEFVCLGLLWAQPGGDRFAKYSHLVSLLNTVVFAAWTIGATIEFWHCYEDSCVALLQGSSRAAFEGQRSLSTFALALTAFIPYLLKVEVVALLFGRVVADIAIMLVYLPAPDSDWVFEYVAQIVPFTIFIGYLSHTQHINERRTFALVARLREENINLHIDASGGSLLNFFRLVRKAANEGKVRPELPRRPWEIALEDLDFDEEIGSGAFGVVYKAKWRDSVVCVKKLLAMGHLSDDAIEAFVGEASMLSELRHPNVLLFIGAHVDPEEPLIVTEFMDRGSLFDVLSDDRVQLPWSLRLRIADQAAKGVNYLHRRDRPILHRDLKSPNLLVDSNFHCKVADFGLAVVQEQKQGEEDGINGTLAWTAPEILRGAGHTPQADVYSMGIILWELATRRLPYHDVPLAALPARVVINHLRPNMDLDMVRTAPKAYVDLMQDCWAANSDKRPLFGKIIERLSELIEAARVAVNTAEFRLGGEMALVTGSIPGFFALWDEHTEDMASALATLSRRMTSSLHKQDAGGFKFPGHLGTYVFAFPDVSEALDWARDMLVFMVTQDWPGELGGLLTMRLAVHHGYLSSGRSPSSQDFDFSDSPLETTYKIHEHCPLLGMAISETALRHIEAGSLARSYDLLDVTEAENEAHGADSLSVANEQGKLISFRIVRPSAIADSPRRPDSDLDALGMGFLFPLQDFSFDRHLRQDPHGDVFSATQHGQPVTVRKLVHRRMSERELELLFEIVGTLKQLSHPNLVAVRGVCIQPPSYCMVFSASLPASLSKLIALGKTPIMRATAAQLARGLKYLHANGVLHNGPMTSDQVWVDNPQSPVPIVQVSEFGLSRLQGGSRSSCVTNTVSWTAPEVLRGKPASMASDVYAFAIVVWQLVAKKDPFPGMTRLDIAVAVIKGERPSIPPCDPEIAALLNRSWHADPLERPSFDEIERVLGAEFV